MREATVHHLPARSIEETVLRRFRIGVAVLIASCAFVFGCSTKKPLAEAPPPSPTVQVNQPQEIAKLPPPEPNQVQEAVKRVFKESVLIETSHKPAFVVGDFNGDTSEDIAVVLKPATEKLSELNEEFPNWILRDLSGPSESKSPRLRIAADEVLLAVIHGYGARGWRDPQATQTFLLKHAAGSSMEAQSANSLQKTNQGRKIPSLRGDVVAETLGGRSGYLYYGNSTYAWYDPKSFSGDPEPRRGHGAPDQKEKK